MKKNIQPTLLAISLAMTALTLSNTTVASSDANNKTEPEGVLLDISQVDPKNDPYNDTDTGFAIFGPSLDTVDSKGGKPATIESVVVQIIAAKSVAPTPVTEDEDTDASGVIRTTEPAPESVAVAVTKDAAKEVSDEDQGSTESSDNKVLATIVEAMRPKDQVPPLNNDRLSLYLSDYVAFAQFEQTASRFNLDRGRTHLAFLYSEERDTVAQGGLSLDASFTSSFRLSFGARAYIALLNLENMDAFAGALGAETAYKLPFTVLPLEFGASVYYAPDILTFGAGDRVIDWQGDVTMPVRSQFSVFGGVRFLQVDTRPADREIDNRVHLGVRWDFL